VIGYRHAPVRYARLCGCLRSVCPTDSLLLGNAGNTSTQQGVMCWVQCGEARDPPGTQDTVPVSGNRQCMLTPPALLSGTDHSHILACLALSFPQLQRQVVLVVLA
jgi:hypothetical protein